MNSFASKILCYSRERNYYNLYYLKIYQFLRDKLRGNQNFVHNILFIDEATFTKQRDSENANAVRERHYQHGFKVTACASILKFTDLLTSL